MSDTVHVQIMNNFLIFINDSRVENPIIKSRKGAALISYLVLNQGQSVPNQRLLRALWEDHKVTNPENALKTLISRVRSMLNQFSEGLGGCIVSDRGAYHWESLPGTSVDVLEILDILDTLKRTTDAREQIALYKRLQKLYKGDLFQTGAMEDEAAYAEYLHQQYLQAVYNYVDLLNDQEEYNEISAVCRLALEVDSFDDRLHIELMKAMVNLNRVNDALRQYKHAASMTYRYLGVEPSAEMQDFYRQMSNTRKTLKFNLDAIRNELYESSTESGAFVCEYPMFREIYNLQMRNLERLGTSMCLGIIMVARSDGEDLDSFAEETVLRDLTNILRKHLRKGDIITHYAPSIIAVLLPTANFKSGSMVMERIQMLFYKQHPQSDVHFYFRLGMLGKSAESDDSQTGRQALRN